MYADRTHLRDKPIKARFNDDEWEAVHAIAKLNKREPAVFVRELVLSFIAASEAQVSPDVQRLEGPREGLRRLCA